MYIIENTYVYIYIYGVFGLRSYILIVDHILTYILC